MVKRMTTKDRSKADQSGTFIPAMSRAVEPVGKLAEQNDRWKLAEHYLPNV